MTDDLKRSKAQVDLDLDRYLAESMSAEEVEAFALHSDAADETLKSRRDERAAFYARFSSEIFAEQVSAQLSTEAALTPTNEVIKPVSFGRWWAVVVPMTGLAVAAGVLLMISRQPPVYDERTQDDLSPASDPAVAASELDPPESEMTAPQAPAQMNLGSRHRVSGASPQGSGAGPRGRRARANTQKKLAERKSSSPGAGSTKLAGQRVQPGTEDILGWPSQETARKGGAGGNTAKELGSVKGVPRGNLRARPALKSELGVEPVSIAEAEKAAPALEPPASEPSGQGNIAAKDKAALPFLRQEIDAGQHFVRLSYSAGKQFGMLVRVRPGKRPEPLLPSSGRAKRGGGNVRIRIEDKPQRIFLLLRPRPFTIEQVLKKYRIVPSLPQVLPFSGEQQSVTLHQR